MGFVAFVLFCYIIYLRIRSFHVKLCLEDKVYAAWQDGRLSRDDATYLTERIKKL